MARSFFKNMLLAKDRIGEEKDYNAGLYYKNLEMFVTEGKYTSYRGATKMSRLLLNGYGDSYIANYFGITETTVRVHRRDMSCELYKLFGNNFFDLLKEFTKNKEILEDRMFVAHSSDYDRRSFVLSEVINFVATSGATCEELDVTVNDCPMELSFLMRYGIQAIKEEMKDLDLKKLDYLFKVLDGELGDINEKSTLLNLLRKVGNDNGKM